MLNGFPSAIEVGGTFCDILTDYRRVIEWFSMCGNNQMTDYEKVVATVRVFCKEPRAHWDFIREAYAEIVRFICLGEEPEGDAAERVTDFQQDFKYIWSGFRKVYGIDLLKEDLHWWAFRLLLDELPDDCMYKQVIAIRTKSINPGNQQETFRLIELKEKYALKED